jgi:FlaG/FlaF family flagellin (archaellin)
MDFDQRKRKDWRNDSGVSEVIGNILILMITVILFSSIIAFVQQMPVPEQVTKVDFSASITFSDNSRHANLTLVHAGGKVLLAKDIRIDVDQDNAIYPHNLSEDSNFTSTTWSTGKPWTVQLDGLRSTSTIVVTVVDLERSQMIWTSQVTGGAVGSPPNIQQR